MSQSVCLKIVVIMTILLSGFFVLSCNVQPVKSEAKTWTVDDDGPADFKTIQEAVNAAHDGDTVHVNKGIYFEHIVVGMSISLIGEDRSTVIIDGNGTGTVVHVTANNTVISGFTIRDSGEKFDYEPALWCALMVGGYEMPVMNTMITNNCVNKNYIGVFLWSSINSTLVDNDIENNTIGVGLANCVWNNIERNTISRNGVGIMMDFASQNDVDSNTITSNKSVGLAIDDSSLNKIRGNHIEDNEYGIDVRDESDNNKITDNTIRNNEFGISIFTQRARLNIIYHNNFLNNTKQVDTASERANIWDNGYPFGGNYWNDYDGIDADIGGIGDDPYVINEKNIDRYPIKSMLDTSFPVHNLASGLGYSNIHQAIAAAQTGKGHIITVDEGTYYEHVFLNKTVSLVGESKNNTIIDGGGTGRAIDLRDGQINISGFTVQRALEGVYLLNTNGSTLQNLTLCNNSRGIVLSSSSNCTIKGNMITDNGIGIWLNDCDRNRILQNTVANNYKASGYIESVCIYMENCNNMVVSGNIATKSSDIGIWVWGSGGTEIVGNVITSNQEGGVYLGGSRSTTVRSNVVLDNEYFGVIVTGSNGTTFCGNTIAFSERCSIDLSSDNTVLYHNNLYGWTYLARDLVGNVWDNSYNEGTEGNYWSEYKGDDLNRDGIGDTPYTIDEENRDNYPLMRPYVDVNFDGRVNIVDISFVAKAFGSRQGDEKYDLRADIDCNDGINIVDVSIAAAWFGHEWQEWPSEYERLP